MLVEDEDLLRQPASKMLTQRGVSVIEAADGWAALEVIRAQQTTIDVLVLDITIPGASSREVLDEARRLRPQMQVIVASAYPAEVVAPSLQTAVPNFLRKPYSLGDLVALIEQVVA